MLIVLLNAVRLPAAGIRNLIYSAGGKITRRSLGCSAPRSLHVASKGSSCLSASLRRRGTECFPSPQAVGGGLSRRREPPLGLRNRTVGPRLPVVGRPPSGSAEGTG